MADIISRLVTEIIETAETEEHYHSAALVDGVTSKGDGTSVVTISWRGATELAVNAYLASYTPVVGHMVLIARDLGQTVIIGRLVNAL